MLNNRDLVR